MILASDDSRIDLKDGWEKVWVPLKAGMGGDELVTALTAIGVCIVAFAVIKWLWGRRRSGPQAAGAGGGLMVMLAIGCVLAAPNMLLPLVLGLVDWLTNGFFGLIDTFTA
ncbi:hypothetical protein [Phytoactinopolyspora mesophila]|uniref:Uncharacterized protein n=1 Tax=Phytoactinopolyspora mesophila TaxID=2650750 RepID=A0A7K3MAE8_9ACTN|nr:hypothetical protein [Phytoactinopolyspora mesophila]NDL60236.1 hypothetical protein [Phytoactinopolyspora mesophila]